LATHHPECLVFYAEAAWTVIAQHDQSANALRAEEELAALADIVVIIVESPGTFAELGAFALSEPLRKKLLPILDEQYRGTNSFLETGPVRWIDHESLFAPPLWFPFDRILERVEDVEERLQRLPAATAHRVPNLTHSHKHLLFFACDLVAIFGPCPHTHITFFIEQLLGAASYSVSTLLGLGKALRLLESFQFEGVDYFFRPLEHGRLRSFQYTGKYINIPTLRARVLSAMQVCPPSSQVLDRFGEHNSAS
jgi:hypothetical protein